MSEVIYISNARLSFPHIAEPQRKVDKLTGRERVSYSCDIILPKEHDGFVKFMRQYGALALEKWKENAQTVMTMIQNDRKQRCYGSGDEKISQKTFKPYDGYIGNVFITAGNKAQPQIIDADGKLVDPANTMACQQLARKLYAGCRINVAIKPWLQYNDHGNGVRCDLVAVQFAGDDAPFGEGLADVTGIFGTVASSPAAQAAPAAMPASPFAGAPGGLPPFFTQGS